MKYTHSETRTDARTKENERGRAALLSEHIKKYLIVYTLISMAVAIPIGYYTVHFSSANKGLFSNLIILFAIMTIYPSMIQLKSEGFVKELKSWKPIVVSLMYVFVLSPAVAFALGPSLGPSIGTGFVVSNIVPASSASLGYVLIAGGSIELATALAIVSLVFAVPAIPIILGLYSSQSSVAIPVGPIMLSVLYILILPLIAGQITRHLIMRWKGPVVVNNTSKKYLSLTTMLSMLALIFVLVDKEASIIVSMPQLVGYLIGYQSAIIIGILALSTFVSRLMHLTYEKHQAVAFISVTKNQSVAAAIAVFALNSEAALAPAVIPMIQPVLAIMYIHLERSIKRVLNYPKKGVVSGH
ncbi:MAG: bile acid:sodium symporter [Candidatus Thermoplasmatota archaeon]|nr:bile acid:sodium symporter [Candidatus Thermoplasmatota archaeon]